MWARNVVVTFLLSGLWHGASWNYVLWGLYHGAWLVVTRAHQILRPAKGMEPGAAPRTSHLPFREVLQIAGMFVLTLVGWLLFRETELSAIVRDLRLVPWHSTPFERQAGLYLFLLAFGYSIPLWAQSIWVETHRGSTRGDEVALTWGGSAIRALSYGVAFAAILVLRSRTSLDFIYFQF